MSDDLNDELRKVSVAIARLEEKAAAAEERRDKMCHELHQINAKLDDLDRLRQRGWGILAGVALAGGGLSAALTKWLGH